jgi:hypothetical protein
MRNAAYGSVQHKWGIELEQAAGGLVSGAVHQAHMSMEAAGGNTTVGFILQSSDPNSFAPQTVHINDMPCELRSSAV